MFLHKVSPISSSFRFLWVRPNQNIPTRRRLSFFDDAQVTRRAPTMTSFCRFPANFRVDYALSREEKNKTGGKMYIQNKMEEYKNEVHATTLRQRTSFDTRREAFN